jgi:outer membrane protein OmpA-like peptidoglycan-associated protein
MIKRALPMAALVILCTASAWPQNDPRQDATVPIYRVTVVDRVVSAVDYQYRSGPTFIDFRGTVLLPQAKGEAIVESKDGRVEIDAKFERVLPPGRFGAEYLTYVLWAITPEGHAQNLGEILAGPSDKAHLRVTTDLQAFGLVVTAEPYSAARQPSDVVVLENQIRPDTMGRTEPIKAKYELLPRGHYTYNVPNGSETAGAPGPSLSMNDYRQVVEIYQAQNAIQIAAAAGAGQYAEDTFRKANDLFAQAQQARANSAGVTSVVTLARQAAQTAEDARILAVRRKQESELTDARQRAALAEEAKAKAEASAMTAQTEAAAARALLEQERAANKQPTAYVAPPPQPETVVVTQPQAGANLAERTARRQQLFRQLNEYLPALDTPRGLVVTIPGSEFRDASPHASTYKKLAELAQLLRSHSELAVRVEGYGPLSVERAGAVRDILAQDGVKESAISARGLGDARPLTSNSTASGREQNRRVEIIIYGESIGQLPTWAKAYSVMPGR